MRFVLFVEGHTERDALGPFLKRWLDPRLERPVGIQVVRFNGWQHLVHDVAVRARLHLEGPRGSGVVAAVGLLDLYGPDFYPPDRSSAEERRRWAIGEIQTKVDHPRFRMFFAVHELEAWILSQPENLPQAVRQALPQRVEQPESIDFNEPPAKLLDRLYEAHTGRGYKKRTYGRNLLDRLDPEVAYRKCPCLAEMLNYMLEAARAALLG
ncbi:MAG: DUF4276 family protein [Acidobacteria bacterium]|nr:DUF4276 family protein [Acidobacteriota bacterium]